MKKILCLFLACCISCTLLVLPASATPLNTINDVSRFLSDTWNIINYYENGEISKDEAITKFGASMVRFDVNYSADVTSFKDFLKVYEFCGFEVPDKWKDWYYENKMGGAGGGGNRDDSILDGYGCCITVIYMPRYPIQNIYFGDYGIIDSYGNAQVYCSTGVREKVISDINDPTYTRYDSDVVYSSSTYIVNFSEDNKIQLYGDWRHEDGSTADDKITELPEKAIPTYDDESVSDDDLIDFLEDLLQDLMLQFPDLSTVEGLLRAILGQLGTLDSDNDNELLSHILTAIEALKTSETGSDNTELIQTLEDLKKSLVTEDEENVLSSAELLKQLCDNQIKLSDITIDESLYNQRFELIQTKLLGKFSFIDEMHDFIDYALTAYSSSTSPNISFSIFGNSYNIDFSAFDDSIDLIRFCIAAFCYLSFVFVTFRKIPSYINGGDNL